MNTSDQKRKIMFNSPHFSPTEFIQNFNHSNGTEEMAFILSHAFEQVREEQGSYFFRAEQDNQAIKQDVTTIQKDVASIKKDIFEVKEHLTHMVTHKQLEARFDLADAKLEAIFTQQDAKFEARFNQQDAKFEARLNEQDAKFVERFNQQDAKFEARFNQQDAKFEARFNQQDAKFEARFNNIDTKIERIDTKLNHLGETFKYYATREELFNVVNKAKWQTIGTVTILFIFPFIAKHFGF